jgi:TatD DNase family protein
MIDVHCHLCFGEFSKMKDAVVQQSKQAGLDALVNCALPADLKESFELMKKYPDFVFTTVGLHPLDIKEMTQKEIDSHFDFIREHADEIVAIGEIGLEKKDIVDEEFLQRTNGIFIQELDLAKELNKPVVLHLRKAEQEGFDAVVAENMKEVVFHYYSGNMTLAKQIVEKGFYISIPTTINNRSTLKDIAKKLPLEFLLTETDSPFSSPIPNTTNVPQNIKVTIAKIAELRKMPIAEVNRITTENAKRVFRL